MSAGPGANAPYWERAERFIELLTGGVRVPGSGRGHQKGDVLAGDDRQWMIEIKSSVHDHITLQRTWFTTLEAHRHSKELLLVVLTNSFMLAFMFVHGHLRYGLDFTDEDLAGWKSMKLKYPPHTVDGSSAPPADQTPPFVRFSDYGYWSWMPVEELRNLQ